MKWRHKGWENPFSEGKIYVQGIDASGVGHVNYEAGADAQWEAIRDYIAELSKAELKDDKMFRVKLLQWLG